MKRWSSIDHCLAWLLDQNNVQQLGNLIHIKRTSLRILAALDFLKNRFSIGIFKGKAEILLEASHSTRFDHTKETNV